MPLDPSIYNLSGKVNLGQGLSAILDQQRQREMQQVQQEQSLANLAQQRAIGGFQLRDLQRREEAIPQQEMEAKAHKFNSWLSEVTKSGRSDDEIVSAAMNIGGELGIPPESAKRYVQNVLSQSKESQARSDFAFSQAYPELVAKQRAEAMFKTQETKPQAPHYDAERGVWVMPPTQGKAVSVPVEGVKPKPKEDKSIDLEMKLADDYRMESKGFAETSTSMKKVLSAIENADKNAASALAAGTAFMKILDPGSVVRETELGMALNASGWFDRAGNIVEKLNSGVIMTKEQKDNLKAAANDLFEEAKAAQREIDSSYTERATAYNLNPKRIIVDRGQNITAPKKPAVSGVYDTEKEARYQAWKASQGR